MYAVAVQKLFDHGLSPKGHTWKLLLHRSPFLAAFPHTGDRRHALLRTDVAEGVMQNKRVSAKCPSPPLSGGMAVPTLAFPDTFWEVIMLQLSIGGFHQPDYAPNSEVVCC